MNISPVTANIDTEALFRRGESNQIRPDSPRMALKKMAQFRFKPSQAEFPHPQEFLKFSGPKFRLDRVG